MLGENETGLTDSIRLKRKGGFSIFTSEQLHRAAVIRESLLRSVGLKGDPGQLIDYPAERPVVVVGPGLTEMPVPGWGAVESIVWDQHLLLKNRKIPSVLVNTWKLSSWIRLLKIKPRLVICHYDDLVWHSTFLAKLSGAQLIVVSHNPFSSQANLWTPGFKNFLRAAGRADRFVALSHQIEEAILSFSKSFVTSVIPNGVKVSDFSFRNKALSSKKFVTVGKVDDRKRQIELARRISKEVDLSIIGPYTRSVDVSSFGSNIHFLGEWTKEQVRSSLTNFSALILISRAEADAMVIHEARAAGLAVFATETAIGASSESVGELMGLHVIADSLEDLNEVVVGTYCPDSDREHIRKTEFEKFDLSVNHSRWLQLIHSHLDRVEK